MSGLGRARRLIEALPQVPRALASVKVFRDEAGNIWNALRRGLTDLKKEPETLDTLQLPEKGSIASVWEFMLRLMVDHPKYARQILELVDFLFSSDRWAQGFLEAKNIQRLSLWKLKASAHSELSPVSLAVKILDMGVRVDDLLPATALESGPDFVEDLANALKGRSGFQTSELGMAWKETRQAKHLDLPAGNSTEDLGDLAAANQAQADSIEAAGKTDRRPGCRKDIVDSLLDALEGAVELTEMYLKPMMSGYDGEANVASAAKDRIMELKKRQADLQASLVIMGPCQVGKTYLTYALVGFAALPPSLPSMVTTRWVHTPSLVVPRMTMADELVELLGAWTAKLLASPEANELEAPPMASKANPVEGIDAVAAALEAVQRTIHQCRTLGVVSAEELAALCRPALCIQVDVQFSPLADLEGELTDTGVLSLVDLPSPDTETLWETEDAQALCRSALRDADGALVVVDASKHEVPQWMGCLLREAFAQEHGGFRREDAWIIANRIDQLSEFFCKDGPKDVCKEVTQRQYKNYKDVILSEDHVIPISARLSLLAMYGREKVREPTLSAQFISNFDRQPWFAQLCSLILGINWMTKVQGLEQTKWRQSMRELHLMGQVTGPLATSVLKTAYVTMLPQSVERVMLDLSTLASAFCTALHYLEGPSNKIDVQNLTDVFRTFFQDVEGRVKQCFRDNAPGEKEMRRLAEQKCPDGIMTFDGPDGSELHLKYFELLAREALQAFQPCYEEALKNCLDQVVIAHNKYLRSLDYYLQKDGVGPFAKQKFLLDAKNVAFITGSAGWPLPSSERDRTVKSFVKQAPVQVHWKLFQRTRRTYAVTTETILEFQQALLDPWLQAAESEVERRCLQPIQKAQDELQQAMEEHNRQRDKGRRRKESSKVDFSFAPKLAEVLKKITTFRSENALAADEAERCEQLCQEIRSTVQVIEKKR